MPLRKMEVEGGLFQIAMTQQDLNGAQIRAGFEQMRGETVAQRVRMDCFLDAGPLGGIADRRARRPWCDGPITGVRYLPGNSHRLGLRRNRRQCCTEFFEQHRTEHYVAISATFAALDVNHHSLAVDVADFQARQFGTPQSGGVERHQQSAMEGNAAESISRATSSWLRIVGKRCAVFG